SSRRRHTRLQGDWSSDVCSSDLEFGGSDEHYLQPDQLFHNERNGKFREVSGQAGPGFGPLHAGRGVAFGDIDNDGRIDILINNRSEERRVGKEWKIWAEH